MIRSIGLIELNSIAKGIETADTMIKAAKVHLLLAKTVCPGKYIVLIAGNVGAVEASVAAGLECGGAYVVDELIIPNIHPQLIPAINSSTEVERLRSLGVMEFFSIASAIVAADAAVKAADVELIEVRPGIGIGGKAFVTLTGEVSAVRSAVESGAAAVLKSGMMVNKVVIPSPGKELLQSLL
ncbi:BMC domain-containing protein [Fonticella tunisiensis]|uniref:Microcompartment protein CcmL/EutN n=1 Tax=Fonticella tunisiensis TaxID=1096341 RepID=A0A4R7K8S7_9CLOT|nr:BMC domain-containing protein [Fonticella tunisiensis]TDT50369.1 microcompartment protein CcmL/EutN [Fonticella tunisiensis]